MQPFLEYSAWAMKTPAPYGLFHLIICLCGIPLAIFLAWKLRHITEHNHKLFIFIIGLILISSELYKQLFHFYIMDDHVYDVWIIPFQLCSIPMYLCLCLPFIKHLQFIIPLETFLMDFTFLGGIMALAFPYDLMQPYITMTLHSFIWHFIIILLGFYMGFSHHGDTSFQGYLKTLPILFICVVFAQILNTVFHNYGEINMFYISPYLTTTQPVFSYIAEHFGITISNVVYLSTMCLGALLIHVCFQRYQKSKNIIAYETNHHDPV